jgi:hypothetical protein
LAKAKCAKHGRILTLCPEEEARRDGAEWSCFPGITKIVMLGGIDSSLEFYLIDLRR